MCPSRKERSCLESIRRCKRSRCGFAGQSGSLPPQDPVAECRKRMSPCRRGRCVPTRIRRPQAPQLSTFAGLNTAPFDPVLELSCPPPVFQERSAQSNPHPLLSIYCRVAATSSTARPFRPRPTRTAATTGETQQLGHGPGIERTDLNAWLQNSQRIGTAKRGLSTTYANRAANQLSAAGCRTLDRNLDLGRIRRSTPP